jgi:hypothetical protein
VKLEIQEDLLATIGEGTDDLRTFGREELLADLESADMTAEPFGERFRSSR